MKIQKKLITKFLSITIFVLTIFGCSSPTKSYTCHNCKKTMEGEPVESATIIGEEQYWCSNDCFKAEGYTVVDGSETPPSGYHKGSSCSDCSGTGKMTNSGLAHQSGDMCAGCNGKGYHWEKD